MKTLIIDMDNVMADISRHFIEAYNRETGEHIDRQALLGKPEVGAFPQPEVIHRLLHTPGFFLNAPLMKDAQEVVAALNKKYKVFIVSSAMEFPQSLPEKFEWLAKHFPFIGWQQIIFCGSKEVITGDYMIDDYPKNLDAFGGGRLLFTAPHNYLLTGYDRVDSWQDVADRLLKPETTHV